MTFGAGLGSYGVEISGRRSAVALAECLLFARLILPLALNPFVR
jgi:hypothetical protein